ncbi:helix-turn-helix domain-containing protein [Yoonia sp. R2-816]|uniref:helix-turn-helix domain-containing protein n=1 Tax=Yoonia sp. R2-816 TaxID=3342638 RepID=UPI003727BFA8
MALKQQPSNRSPTKHEQVLGQRIERLRLSRNITQADLAEQAGIGIRTLRRLEAGNGGTLDTFFRILSALKLDGNVELLIPDPAIRPIERVRMKGSERKRASSSQVRSKNKQPWRWGSKQDGG